jgi:hypothetical protein
MYLAGYSHFSAVLVSQLHIQARLVMMAGRLSFFVKFLVYLSVQSQVHDYIVDKSGESLRSLSVLGTSTEPVITLILTSVTSPYTTWKIIC